MIDRFNESIKNVKNSGYMIFFWLSLMIGLFVLLFFS